MRATIKERAAKLFEAISDSTSSNTTLHLIEEALAEPTVITRIQIEALVIEIFEDLDRWERADPFTPEEVFSVANTIERFLTKPVGVKSE